MNSNTRDTSADKTSIGFDYQYFYMILLILDLRKNQQLSYELEDDICFYKDDGKKVYMQLKHTLKKKAGGTAVNLRDRDLEFWKTIYNWIMLIESFKTSEKKMTFLLSSEFVLATNKSEANTGILTHIKAYKDGELPICDFVEYIGNLYDETKESKNNMKIREYMRSMKQLDKEILSMLLMQMEFQMSEDYLICRIKDRVRDFLVPEERVDDVFKSIVGELYVWKYDQIKKGEKVVITYNERRKKLQKHFINARSRKLPKRRAKLDIPDDLLSQEFIIELIEIGDINPDSINEIIDYTTYKLQIRNMLDEWLRDGEITQNEYGDIEKNTLAIWRNIHKGSHRKSSKAQKDMSLNDDERIEILKNCALDCLDKIRDKMIMVSDEELTTEESNGHFYMLSDERKLGWKKEWERVY